MLVPPDPQGSAPPDPQGSAPESPDLPLLRGEVAFRLLVDAVQDYAIFLLATDGRVLTWNLGAQRIKGYTSDEIIGQHFSVFYTPEEREAGRPMKLLGQAAENGRFEDEGPRVRKDGTQFWADVIVTALRDESGTPYAFAKITRDLTERRAAEEQQRNLLAEQRARAAAEEALVARDRFLSIASHELKTPAASLSLTVESLQRARAAGRLDDERLTGGLARLATASDRLGVLVDELLDVSRLTAGRIEFRNEPTDLVALARDVIGRFSMADEQPRIHLVGSDEAWVSGDASRLDQVVTNLVDNAVKYSDAAAPIELEVARADGGVTLTVRDRGVGLDDEAAARLFEAFGRGLNTEHIPGLGLGLYISHQIVQRHGGRIEARDRPDGHGSEFTMWLPAGTSA